MRACGSSLTCTIFARLKKDPSSGQPCLILVGRCLIFSLLIYHSTKHHLDSTIFSETTRYTNNHSRKNLFRLFQKLPYRKATPGRKATLKKHSVNLIMKVTEICAPKLPHRQWDPILLSPGRTGFSGIQTPITSANWIEIWKTHGVRVEDLSRIHDGGQFNEIQKMMGELQCDSADFKDRIIIMSMFNEIVRIRLKMSSRWLVFPGAWIQKEVVRNLRVQTRWILESNCGECWRMSKIPVTQFSLYQFLREDNLEAK